MKKILVAILLLILVAAIFGVTFVWNLSQRSVPDYRKNVEIRGLKGTVEVYRDSFAIPHIYAEDLHDLYLTTGYLLAQDRLWQMDMLRRVTQGRLSEIFGERFVDTDLLLRSLRFGTKSKKILAVADSSSMEALNAFAEGINLYIADHKHSLPPEFGILKYRPEPWKPEHSLNMIGYMAWDLKAGWSEILLDELKNLVDSARFKELLPDLGREQPVVFSQFRKDENPAELLPEKMLHSYLLDKLGADVFDGSNNWAVSGMKSMTGMPLLANDMHLGLNVPGIWYQIHQVVKGKLNVTGLILPGAPVVICGHNDSIAWGMTNTYVDNLDFYGETINPADSNQYEFNGSWRNFEVRKEVVRTNSGKQVEGLLRFTHRGAVVSAFKHFSGKVISMHWVGDESSNEFKTVMMLNHANNWNDFRDALRTFTSISQNVVYADKKGNIGLYCAAGVPVRKRDIAYGFLPGNTDEYDWKGYVPFDELPHTFNPEQGYVASANNRTVTSDYPYHIGSWYSLPGRFERISALLAEKHRLSIVDFIAIQADQHSMMAEKYLPAILKSLGSGDSMNVTERKSLALLKEWDYSMDSRSAAAALFETTYLQFIRCIFADEMGGKFEAFNGVSSISRNATDRLFEYRNSSWFDNVNTSKKETFEDAARCAFHEAVSELTKRLGPEPGEWQWGKIHHLILAHPLSTVKILDRIFDLNRGPFEVGGSFHTVSPFSYDPNDPFDSNHGSSHRHIYDPGNWDNSLTVIPTGISGIPASKHYCDQTSLYLSNKYHHDYFSKELIIAHARYKMKFLPESR